MKPLSKWSLYYSLHNNIIELYQSFLFHFIINQTSTPYGVNTRSQNLHPIISWITYLHSPNTLLLVTLHWLLHISNLITLFTNKENIFPLYHILKIIPWVGLEAFLINYNRTSLRYDKTLHLFIITSYRRLTIFTISHTSND